MMSTEPLISIIVPVYNSGPCLKKCLDSILNQRFTSLEIIVVNDGSTDNSGEILESYSKNDKRVVIVTIQNSGVSVARNIGLSQASGEYIGFVDSDDWISDNMYLKMYEIASSEKYDIVQCSYSLINYTDNRERKIKKSDITDRSYSGNRQLISAYFKGEISPSVCNKIFKSSIVKRVSFNAEVEIGEDNLFVYYCCQQSMNAYVMNDILYYYYQTPHSAMRSILSYRNFQPLNVFKMQMEEYKNDSEMCSLIVQRKVYLCIDLLLKILKSGKCTDQILYLRDEIKKYRSYIFKNKHSLKIKLATYLISAKLEFFIKLYKIMYTKHDCEM